MKWQRLSLAAMMVISSSLAAPSAHAISPVGVVVGTTWDGPGQDLQTIVDGYLGAPGLLNVQADFVGAHVGDLDPWFWAANSFPTLLITEVAANSNTNELGWYRETFTRPMIDGVDDGVLFTGAEGSGVSTFVSFPSGLQKFGFYLDTHTMVSTPSGTQPQVFLTNRMLNDIGPAGYPATHAPANGDVQALVFDVSRWKGPNTWLVCFEDTDSGRPIGPCCGNTDNDFNDLVFQITAAGATPTQNLSFGALKATYR